MIAIINGPNLNMLGKRDTSLYGYLTLDDICLALSRQFADEDFRFFQSNHEGDIVDFIQQLHECPDCKGVVINPGALAHYSYSIADALRDLPYPAVEVHISNIHSREDWRVRSVTAQACRGMITGLGAEGYILAVKWLIDLNTKS